MPAYGVQSAPLYRGLLNLAYLWFDPGRTRFPVRGGKHWLQVEDPERYPTITNDLLIELFYPTSTNKQRKRLAFEARKSLAQLVKNDDARIVKGLSVTISSVGFEKGSIVGHLITPLISLSFPFAFSNRAASRTASIFSSCSSDKSDKLSICSDTSATR